MAGPHKPAKLKATQAFFKEYIESGTDIRYGCFQDTDPILRNNDRFWKPFTGNPNRAIGLHLAYNRLDGTLDALALALDRFCAVIMFSEDAKAVDFSKLDEILTRPTGLLVAFNAGELAYILYHRAGIRVTNLVNIDTAIPNDGDTHPLSLTRAAVDGDYRIFEDNMRDAFETEYFKDENNQPLEEMLVRKAWLAQFLPTLEGKQMLFQDAVKIDSSKLPEELLSLLSDRMHSIRRAVDMGSRRQEHDMVAVVGETGTVLQASRFQNRFRRTAANQFVEVEVQTPRGVYMQSGVQVGQLRGAKASLVLPNHQSNARSLVITSAATIGRDKLTLAEANLKIFLTRVLIDHSLFTENPWIRNIEIASSPSEMTWPDAWKGKKAPRKLLASDVHSHDTLNPSQSSAIQQMMSPSSEDHMCLIHGPPGTGKTTVIARYVQSISALATAPKEVGIWLIAESNVAVKNIAEKLFSVGFKDWKLLVSQEFQEGWHDHLYEAIKAHVIPSNIFKEAVKKLYGCQVILCTLSTLSNRHISAFAGRVPFKNLIIDEASQVKVFDYYHIFHTFKSTLRKVVFIGDPKQLPPHGQEEIKDLSSIFEKPHLTEASCLLKIQYRMPPQIGHFISSNVYDNKLSSNPKHPILNTTLACQFIDTKGGETKDGTSFKNLADIEAAMLLATHLEARNLSYRIITGYDAQRSALEAAMKQNPNVNWKDKCFNVDSFQGNEDDYIIISLVRTWKPGFLQDLRRTNVMLSRCKRGMIILGNRTFLEGKGKDCLVGKLAQHMMDQVGEAAWLDRKELDKDTFEFHRHVDTLPPSPESADSPNTT